MVSVKRFFNTLLIVLLATSPVHAENPLLPFELKGIYELNIGQVRFAQLGIEMEQQAGHYDITADVITSGIVKLFSKHKSHSTSSGSGSAFSYPRRSYETNYSTRKKKKYVKLVYEGGRMAAETLVPPENRAKRPAVPGDLLAGSIDPLLLILKMRQELLVSRQDYMLDVYDGRRLHRAHFTVLGKKKLPWGKSQRAVVAVQVTREMVAGFTQDEINEADKNEPPLTVYFSDDARLTPIRIETQSWLGLISATLIKECRTGESCLLGLQ